jgi:hypothetical protein
LGYWLVVGGVASIEILVGDLNLESAYLGRILGRSIYWLLFYYLVRVF